MSQRNVEIVRTALEAFRRGDVERALEMADPELVSRRVDPDASVWHGREGLMALIAEWVEGFSEWSYRSDEFTDLGDTVVVRVHQWGRGAASGAPVEGDYWLVYELADSRITSLAIYSEREPAMAAAGRGTEDEYG